MCGSEAVPQNSASISEMKSSFFEISGERTDTLGLDPQLRGGGRSSPAGWGRAGDDRIGLRTSIRGRIEQEGGTARIWSRPGVGTTVVLTVPEGGG